MKLKNMTYLDPDSLSPDPTYGNERGKPVGNSVQLDVYPHALLKISSRSPSVTRWKRSLNLHERPAELTLKPDADNRLDLLLDFGTELDAALVLDIELNNDVNLMACFGESKAEAEGLVPGYNPNPAWHWHLNKGRRHVESAQRGFRFVRLVFSDVKRTIVLKNVFARASFTFRERKGDFLCSDKRFQRVWQSSVYTARLCTRENTIWDGIKRDRIGWYGDARIIKLAVDNVFLDPLPAEAMLMALPTDSWANTIPNYSFDAIAMLKQHVMVYGVDRPCVRDCYKKFLLLLNWAWRTQCDRNGMIKRTDRPYFGSIGFLDWSSFPCGGRFEELCWLQCKYLEALRNTSDVARLLKDSATVSMLETRITRLERLIKKRFWNPRKGFVHTLNHVGKPSIPDDAPTGWRFKPFNVPMFDIHYKMTYEERVRMGPSGASRQANALAVLAGLASGNMTDLILKKVFDNQSIPPVITAYFSYYEQRARGLCGDASGAVLKMREYIGNMLEKEDAATIWEVYNPDVADLRKYIGTDGQLWTWPISLCHGWGAGAVPVATEFLLGIKPVEPGFASVSINPCFDIPWSFEATIPTPRGVIRMEREKQDGPLNVAVPRGISLTPKTQLMLSAGGKIQPNKACKLCQCDKEVALPVKSTAGRPGLLQK